MLQGRSLLSLAYDSVACLGAKIESNIYTAAPNLFSKASAKKNSLPAVSPISAAPPSTTHRHHRREDSLLPSPPTCAFIRAFHSLEGPFATTALGLALQAATVSINLRPSKHLPPSTLPSRTDSSQRPADTAAGHPLSVSTPSSLTARPGTQ